MTYGMTGNGIVRQSGRRKCNNEKRLNIFKCHVFFYILEIKRSEYNRPLTSGTSEASALQSLRLKHGKRCWTYDRRYQICLELKKCFHEKLEIAQSGTASLNRRRRQQQCYHSIAWEKSTATTTALAATNFHVS